MTLIGHTPGGSSIFSPYNQKTNSGPGRTLYGCSKDPRHRLTKNQARSNGYVCSHCGADLNLKKQKIQELNALARSLNMRVIPNEDLD